MHIRLYKRHEKDCGHKDDKNYMRCACSVWLAWGKTRKSAGTPIKERAQEKADAIKKQFEDAELGIVKPQASTAALVEDALKKFLDDKRGQNLEDETISKHRLTTSRLLDFCRRKGILFMHEITLPHLTEHRVEWNTYFKRPLCKRTNQERLRSFFRYCEDAGWITKNPAAKLSSIKIKKDEQVATQPFEPEEMVRILAAIPKCNFTPDCARRVRTEILIQRHAGLAIQDAIKVPRTQMTKSGKDYRIIMKRTKTGVGINNLIPGWVGEEILSTPNLNPKYFLWSGNGKPKSAVAYFQRLLKKVFTVAGIPEGHSHRLRDTFACELLLAGVDIRKVSKALGHDSVATTEKYYGAWCKRHQESLDKDIRASWPKTEKQKRPGVKRPGSSVPSSGTHGEESVVPDSTFRVQ
jgi:integrase/recombinase XerD